MKLEKSNPDTAFLEQEVQYPSLLSQSGYVIQKHGAGGSISEPSESEWLRDTEAEEREAKNEQIFLLIILVCLAKS